MRYLVDVIRSRRRDRLRQRHRVILGWVFLGCAAAGFLLAGGFPGQPVCPVLGSAFGSLAIGMFVGYYRRQNEEER